MLASVILITVLVTGGQNHTTPSLDMFAGTWKEDLAKRHVKPPSTARLSFTRSSDGLWTMTSGTSASTLTMKFRMDGKDYPLEGVPGATESWREAGPDTWESITKRDGRLLRTARRVISDGGKRLTVTSTFTSDNRQQITTTTFERMGNGSGLAGEWKQVAHKKSEPDVLTIQVTSPGELKVRTTNGGTFTARVDGKEYTYTGPRILPNITITLRETGPRTIEETYFRDHKPLSQTMMTVSEDGKTLTRNASDPNTQEQTGTAVFEKQ